MLRVSWVRLSYGLVSLLTVAFSFSILIFLTSEISIIYWMALTRLSRRLNWLYNLTLDIIKRGLDLHNRIDFMGFSWFVKTYFIIQNWSTLFPKILNIITEIMAPPDIFMEEPHSSARLNLFQKDITLKDSVRDNQHWWNLSPIYGSGGQRCLLRFDLNAKTSTSSWSITSSSE